jgi:hypothetical protein
MPVAEMTPHQRFMRMVTAGLDWLEEVAEIPTTDEARVIVMAIAGQESNWAYRHQQGGPAHSFWQFEQGGGVHGVLTHAASRGIIAEVCDLIYIQCTDSIVFTAMEWNDRLAISMARLLLWTDAVPLPRVGDVQGAWNYYLRNWRPGAPHPEQWPGKYAIAKELL